MTSFARLVGQQRLTRLVPAPRVPPSAEGRGLPIAIRAAIAGKVDAPGPADPIRVIEAATAGVAFLAAGAIIQARGQVQGLTTGAAMWPAGGAGVACGGGYTPSR